MSSTGNSNPTFGYGPSAPVKVFDGDPNNWELWEDYFICRLRTLKIHTGLSKYSSERPESFDETIIKRSIYDQLTLCLDPVSHGLIRRQAKDDGEEALKVLRNYYLRDTQHRTHTLWRSIINAKMENRSAKEYIAFLDETCSSLKEAKQEVNDGLLVNITLNGLSPAYDSFIAVANQRNPPYEYSSLKIALLDYEDQLNEKSGTNSVMYSCKQKYCPKCRQAGHYPSQCPQKANAYRNKISKANDNSKPKERKYCDLHKTPYHSNSQCYTQKMARKENNQVNVTEETEDLTKGFSMHILHEVTSSTPYVSAPPPDFVHVSATSPSHCDVPSAPPGFGFVAPDHLHETTRIPTVSSSNVFNIDSSVNSIQEGDFVLVDSGSTSHIENNSKRFSHFQTPFNPENHHIKFADGRKPDGIVQGMGNVKQILHDSHGESYPVNMTDSLFIPSFEQPIMSVWKAVNSGNSVHFTPQGSYVQNSQGKVFDIVEKNKLYYLPRSSITNVNAVKNESKASYDLRTWHNIMGHLNLEHLKQLESSVKGMHIKDKTNFDCSTCTLSKMTQFRNKSLNPKATKILEVVHTDIVGPITPASKDGFRYGLSFIDDYSGYIYVYLLKQKSDSIKAMKKFLADTAPYGKVKILRCDNGTEYTNSQFRTLLIDNQIKQEFSSPYSPHHNGTAERSHRTVYEMARALLIESKLPQTMWHYAVKTAVHIRDRCYSPRLKKTLVEIYTGSKPNLAKMQLFGVKCYAYDHSHTSKFEPKCIEGKFVGYDSESPSYLIWFPNKGSIRKCRLVKFFNENSYVGPELITPDVPNPQIPLQSPPTGTTAPGVVSSPTRETSVRAKPAVMPQPQPVSKIPRPITQPVIKQPLLESAIQQQVSDSSTPEHQAASTDMRQHPQRERSKPQYLSDYVTNVTEESFIYSCNKVSHISVPISYDQAIQSPQSEKWKLAMDDEMNSLHENETYELAPLPEGRTPVGGRWVYQVKTLPNGDDKYKARYVAKGFSQIKDVNYFETFSPTARMSTLRTLINISVNKNYHIHQMDVKTAFLNAEIDTEIYVDQPEGYRQTDCNNSKLYCKLKKSLYGLKQSSRLWNKKLHDSLIEQGFSQSKSDYCLYTKIQNNSVLYVLIWVDDLIICASDDILLQNFKQCMSQKFKMTDLGSLNWFLGISFIQKDSSISMHQSIYIHKILSKFNMSDCNPCNLPCDSSFSNISAHNSNDLCDSTLYREIVGSLIYLMICTRPDLSFVVTKLSQFMSKPTNALLSIAKNVLRYLKGTIDYELTFSKQNSPMHLLGYCDSDWGSSEDRKSITGYCFMLNDSGPMISWKCKKQPIVALSSCEAEYISMTHAIQEGLFLRQLLYDLLHINFKVYLGVDNQGSIMLAQNPVNHQRSKHIDIRYHFIRDEIQKGIIDLFYVNTTCNPADMFTKPANLKKLQIFSYITGISV